MTRVQLEAAVGWWIPRLGLAGWRIDVDYDPDAFEDPDGDAISSIDHNYDEGRISFNAGKIAGWNRRKGHAVVVHELLHFALRDVEHVAYRLTDGHLHRDAQELFDRSYRHAVEGAIDRLAYQLVELSGVAE